MKSIFNFQDRNEVVGRIEALNAGSKALWGKMTVSQMVRHCSLCEDYYFGNVPIKRSFLGRIIGKVAINGLLKSESSGLKRNSPTSDVLLVTENLQDLDAEKRKWKSLIEKYGSYNIESFDHWFFGKMTKEQLGQFVYKHCDHHLRQFGC